MVWTQGSCKMHGAAVDTHGGSGASQARDQLRDCCLIEKVDTRLRDVDLSYQGRVTAPYEHDRKC